MYKAESALFSKYKALYTIKYDEFRPASRLGSVKKFGSFRQTPRSEHEESKAIMTTHAIGPFEVKLILQAPDK